MSSPAFRFLALIGLLVLSGGGCASERRHYQGPEPSEELILLFPDAEKRLVFQVAAGDSRLDVGVDYDGPSDSLSLRVESQDASWAGTRLAGSNMRLVACGVPTDDGRIVIIIRNRRSSSRQAALRLAPHKSDMCTPLSPVLDEFWARVVGPDGPAGTERSR